MAGLPKGGYGIVGRMAMRSDKVSKEAKAVYALLCSYTGGKHYCYPSVETLAKDLQTSTRTIIRLTEELKAHGFARKIKVGKDKRKTAYIPLHPYGGIGDTDDTYLEEMDDTSDTQLGDTHGTVRITGKSNSMDMTPRTFEQGKDKTRKKSKIPQDIQDKTQFVYKAIEEVTDKDQCKAYKNASMAKRISDAIDEYGAEVVCEAVRGRAMLKAGQEMALKWLFEGETDFAAALAAYRRHKPRAVKESTAELDELHRAMTA